MNFTKKKITVLVDNESWIIPYALRLVDEIKSLGAHVGFVRSHDAINEGDIMFLLGCMKILPTSKMKMHRLNLTVHESDLPAGKGFAPLFWQILEGKNKIPVCLVELSEKVDSGDIYEKSFIELDGTELNSEIRRKQGLKTIEMCMNFLRSSQEPQKYAQRGEETFYKRRYPADSELDMRESLESQFNLLRIVDNELYPAFFIKDGQKYILKIEKADQ